MEYMRKNPSQINRDPDIDDYECFLVSMKGCIGYAW